MEKFSYTLFYKRNLNKKIEMSRAIKNLKVGDIIKFYGKLYTNKKYLNEVANTIIEYKILLINGDGVLIETNNKYIFNNSIKNGTLEFKGKFFSPNFNIVDGIINSYITHPSILVFNKGTNNFNNGYGYSKYHITDNGIGTIKINMELIK